MKYKPALAYILSILAFSCSTASGPTASKAGEPDKTQVMLLATLHGFHKTNPNYTYNDVYDIIRKYNPDVIGLEIRPEDINEDTTYLKQMYPLEMRQITVLFPKEKLAGFDWYGQEAAGKLLPSDALKGGNNELSNVKLLERQMNADTSLTRQMAMLGVMMQKMSDLAKTSTPAELNNSGQYEIVSELFYSQLATMTKGLPYETYTEFNRQRDKHIDAQINEIVSKNPGKKLVFVMGANHLFAARQTLNESFGKKIILVPVPKIR